MAHLGFAHSLSDKVRSRPARRRAAGKNSKNNYGRHIWKPSKAAAAAGGLEFVPNLTETPLAFYRGARNCSYRRSERNMRQSRNFGWELALLRFCHCTALWAPPRMISSSCSSSFRSAAVAIFLSSFLPLWRRWRWLWKRRGRERERVSEWAMLMPRCLMFVKKHILILFEYFSTSHLKSEFKPQFKPQFNLNLTSI